MRQHLLIRLPLYCPEHARKASVINKLAERFNLIFENVLPSNSFHLPDGGTVPSLYDVPCVWQVWEFGAQSHPQ